MWLVVAVGVEDQLPDQLAVLGDHPDPQPVDQRQYARARKPSTEPDVMEPRVVTKRDHPGDVDLVPPDANMGRNLQPRQRRSRLRPGGKRFRRCAAADRSVGPHVVLVGAEPVELGLELADRCRRLVLGQPALDRLMRALDLPARLRVVGLEWW